MLRSHKQNILSTIEYLVVCVFSICCDLVWSRSYWECADSIKPSV